VIVRDADPDEGERLREIAIASKASWGYDLARVREWAAAGDFTPEGLARTGAFVAEVDGVIAAWAALIPRGEVAWLEDLWVDPAWMRRGIGAVLFAAAAERARATGARRLEWEAEPHALPFYERMGAREVRESGPTSWGRIVPVLSVDLA
jgi:GNAT superfamily N-acetyltransferase